MPLRSGDLRPRMWFAAGDTVRIVAGGSGWHIRGEGQALGPGVEGQVVRVRTESGRIISGMAVADRQVEVAL
jgi:flagella basal body P-ring formation protein FlgA